MKLSSSRKFASLLATAATLSVASLAQAVTFNYASIQNAVVAFDGAGHFNFGNTANNFQVTSGTANMFLGQVTGVYTIGAIQSQGPANIADVTGSGTFIIHDNLYTLSATLTWQNIVQVGTAGALNTVGAVNLSNITYGGFNADLLALKNDASAANVLTFQFVPAVSLELLKTTANSTSFSGTVNSVATTSVPDSGATIALLGLALSGLAVARRTLSA